MRKDLGSVQRDWAEWGIGAGGGCVSRDRMAAGEIKGGWIRERAEGGRGEGKTGESEGGMERRKKTRLRGQKEEGRDAGRQGKMKDGGREKEEGKQKRAEPAGAAEPPPRRTPGRLGSACRDPAARPAAPGGLARCRPARCRRCVARCQPARCGGGCEPRGAGEERVRARVTSAGACPG